MLQGGIYREVYHPLRRGLLGLLREKNTLRRGLLGFLREEKEHSAQRPPGPP